jgi:hypothetical protein
LKPVSCHLNDDDDHDDDDHDDDDDDDDETHEPRICMQKRIE